MLERENEKIGLSTDTLNMILLIDNSYSMLDKGIAQVNQAIPMLRDRLIDAAEEEDVTISLRIIAFSDRPVWKVGSAEKGEIIEKKEDLIWEDLKAENTTATAKAIKEANKALRKRYLGEKPTPPVVILITDGQCTDVHDEYLEAIAEMKTKLTDTEKTAKKDKVLRMAIGAGTYVMKELEEFATMGTIDGVPDKPFVFTVDNFDDLAKKITWVALSSLYTLTGNDDNEQYEMDSDGVTNEDDFGDDDD